MLHGLRVLCLDGRIWGLEGLGFCGSKVQSRQRCCGGGMGELRVKLVPIR